MNKNRKRTGKQSSHEWTDDGFVDLMEQIYSEKKGDRKRILGSKGAIHRKIRQYNQQCPGSFMQKGRYPWKMCKNNNKNGFDET